MSSFIVIFIRAIITCFIHDTYIPPACGTSPFLFLLPEPLFHADLSYPEQIINKAHLVIANMTLIKLFKICAGEILTFKTELYMFVPHQCTISLDPGTILILYPAALTSMLQIFFFQ